MKKVWNTHIGKITIRKILPLSVLCLVLLVPSFIDCKAVTSTSSRPLTFESTARPFQAIDNDNWYTGANESTPQVDVNYSQFMPQADTLDRSMTLWYGNGATRVSMHFVYWFNPGGINDSASSYPNYNPQVLDWTQLNGISFTLADDGSLDSTTAWGTTYSFSGLDIINGTAQQLSLNEVGNSTDYAYMLNNQVGSITYANCSAAAIGPVTLDTENTTYNGNALTDSIATFNVTLDAQIINCQLTAAGPNTPTLPPHQTLSNVPITLMFQVTENSAYTAYKYGVNVDWSADTAFPTTGLNNGDSFSLVTADSLGFGITQDAVAQPFVSFFSTDANNDSAIYSVNGTEVCQEIFPLNYTINGSSQTYNTTRLYVPVQNYVQSTDPSQARNSSTMYVCFDGFYYNQSTGFSFDPTVITYNSASSTNSPPSTNNPNPSPTPSANNQSPTPSTNNPSPTASTTGSKSTPNPLISSTTTTGTPEPSPEIAEFPSLLVILTIFIAVSLSVAVLVTSRKGKIIQAQNAKM
jgi:hypothetical protein